MTSDLALTDREIEVIRHSLGWNRSYSGIAYRSYFSADRGSEDDATWLGLVKRGLAIGRDVSSQPDRVYSIGLRAALAVRQEGEHLSVAIEEKLRRVDENIRKLHGQESSDDR